MMPEGWSTSLLDNVTRRASGHTPNKDHPEYWNGGIKWVSLADSSRLDQGKICKTDKEISALGIQNSSAVLLPAGTVVLSRDAGVGKSAVLGVEMAVSQHFIAWCCDGPGELHHWFLYYLLQYRKTYFERMAVGSTIKTIGLPLFKKLTIEHPPYKEQKKIAEILSTWDRAIETTEALLIIAQAQKRALMQTLLIGKRRFPEFKGQPWNEVQLCDIVEVNPRLDICPIDNRMTFLSMDAVSEEGEIVNPIPADWRTHRKGYTAFKDGDLLVAKITPCFENGKGCHAINLVNGIGTGSTEFHILRPKDERDTRFVFHVVNSKEFRGRGTLNLQGSAGQRRVPTDFIKAYPLNIPEEPDERKKIGILLDEASKEIELHKRAIASLCTEKKALMQQLLTGKRRVKI